MLNLNLGATNTQVNPPPQNNLFGNDLLGFGSSSSNQNTGFGNNALGGNLIGFGNNPIQTTQSNQGNINFGFGAPQQSVPVPVQNTNSNATKILAYENTQIQIWMSCQK